MNLQQVLDEILVTEGGFVDDIDDPGGATKYGVTIKTLSESRGTLCTVEDVQNLAVEEAKEIFTVRYFLKPKINKLPEELQAQMLDISINSGPGTAIRLLQEVLNLAGFGCSVDGGIGPKTIAAAEAAQQAMGGFLTNALVERRELFYKSLARRRPSSAKFLKGWLRRADLFRVDVQC